MQSNTTKVNYFQNYLAIRFYMHIFLGFVVGGLFYQMGNDATKTLFNFGFCFTIIIAFLYVSSTFSFSA